MISNEVLLIFFALPIAVIIISIALQKIFKNPILVAAIIFAIFLIVTFAIGNIQFLIATIAYTILSYITAFLTCIICRCINWQNPCCNQCRSRNICSNNTISNETAINTISTNNETLANAISVTNSDITETINNSRGCGCGNNNDNNNQVIGANGVSARINIIPNNNGTSRNNKWML